ncbi:hypothetical protein EVU94_09290 [Flavobacteriaceae bacterium 144Ye]|nr:hypothetical protein EVU94_09290 [Flavobacteriaceae bacterium 144Ye]
MAQLKIILRRFVLFLLFTLLIACETRFEDNTRILVKGSVKDQYDLAIQNAQINVYTSRVTSFLGGEQEFLLGSGFSDSNGEFSVVSLFDKDEDFSVEIDAGPNHSKYVYKTSTINYEPTNLTFDLGNRILLELTAVNYTIYRISEEGNNIQYSFRFTSEFCSEVYNEGVLNIEDSQCNTQQFLNGALNDSTPDIEGDFYAPTGTEVVFIYSVNEAPESTETFIVENNSNNEFVFSY